MTVQVVVNRCPVCRALVNPRWSACLFGHALAPVSECGAGRRTITKNDTSDCWRAEIDAMAARRRALGDDDAAARAYAYNALISTWHRQHGERTPAGRCAGCVNEIEAGAAIHALPLGEQVHGAGLDCLIKYGRRWRAGAAARLATLGITAPEGWRP